MTGHDRFSCHVTSPTTTTTYHGNDTLPQASFFVLPRYNDDDGHVSLAINEEGVGVQGTPSISFFLLLLTSSQAAPPSLRRSNARQRGHIAHQHHLYHLLPCSNARRRGPIAHHNHNHDPSLARTRDGGALLPTTTPTTTMTPPLLEREMEGHYCPQPQPPPQPLPCSNARQRGPIAHHNHNHDPSLARTRDGGALLPTTTPTTTTTPPLLKRETERRYCPQPQPQPPPQPFPCSNTRRWGSIACQHPLCRSKHERGGSFIYII